MSLWAGWTIVAVMILAAFVAVATGEWRYLLITGALAVIIRKV